MADWPSRGGGYAAGGSDSGSTSGVELTTNASANTKGSWVEVFASLPHDSEWLWISFNPTDSGVFYLLDLAIGAASSEVIIIDNLAAPNYSTQFKGDFSTIMVPIRLKAGTRLSARIQGHVAGSNNCRVNVGVFAANSFPSPGFSRCTTYGANTGSTRGTNMDPGGTAHTMGSWAQVIASTTNRMRALFVSWFHFDTTQSDQYNMMEIGVGAAASEQVIIPAPLIHARANAALDTQVHNIAGPFPVDIPAGSRLAVRGQSSITVSGERDFDAIIYGLD